MPVKSPRPGELEPIERASRDELRALQLERLRWSLAHAYDNVAALPRARSTRAGVHPDDLRIARRSREFPFTVKTDLRDNYPFGMFAVPREQVVRIHASRGTTGKPTVVGYTRKRHRHLGDRDGALDPRRRRPAPATSCTSPTATACSPAASARTTAPRSSAAR